jgi:hypothetical protein
VFVALVSLVLLFVTRMNAKDGLSGIVVPVEDAGAGLTFPIRTLVGDRSQNCGLLADRELRADESHHRDTTSACLVFSRNEVSSALWAAHLIEADPLDLARLNLVVAMGAEGKEGGFNSFEIYLPSGRHACILSRRAPRAKR